MRLPKHSLRLAVCLVAAGTAVAHADLSTHRLFVMDMVSDDVSNDSSANTSFVAPKFHIPANESSFDLSRPLAQLNMFQGLDFESTDFANTMNSHFNGSATTRSFTNGLGSLDSMKKPDNAIVVPLPSSAFAGLGMIIGLAGWRSFKSRR